MTAPLPTPRCGARTAPASGRRRTARSLAARVILVPTAPVWAALFAERTTSHAVHNPELSYRL